MADRPIVLGVATYASGATAVADLRAVSGTDRQETLDHLSVAVLVKDIDGKFHLEHHDTTAAELEWGGALVGGALAVVAAPLAIAPLSVAATRNTTWAGAGGIVGYFWHNIPKGQLLRMSDLAESGQAALVVVVLDHTATTSRHCLATPPRRSSPRPTAAISSSPMRKRWRTSSRVLITRRLAADRRNVADGAGPSMSACCR